MDIDIRDFAADHYAEANKRPPRPEIEAYIKAYDARRQADADARAAPTPWGGVKPRAGSIPTTLARHTAILAVRGLGYPRHVGGAQGRSLSRLPVPANVRGAPHGSLTTADISLTVTASYFNRRFECRSPTGSMRGWPPR